MLEAPAVVYPLLWELPGADGSMLVPIGMDVGLVPGLERAFWLARPGVA